jgi:hypothetical protein
MKLRVGTTIIIAIAFLVTSVSATIVANFLKFGGITYIATGRIVRELGRELRDEDLGPEITKVKFNLLGTANRSAPEPAYGPDEPFAAHLEIGTSIYAVKGYATTFRLAARKGGKLFLFETETNPKARKGADLLDLNQVLYIGVNGDDDGLTELAAIKDRTLVAELVRKVLDAPIAENPNNSDRTNCHIVFHFRDGTVTTRAYRFNSGELSPGIKLSREFATAVQQALKSAGKTP